LGACREVASERRHGGFRTPDSVLAGRMKPQMNTDEHRCIASVVRALCARPRRHLLGVRRV
jgi:hypothetical protein